MNKSHRSVWNESLGAWVAASETTKARGKRSKSARLVAATFAGLVLAGASMGSAFAEDAPAAEETAAAAQDAPAVDQKTTSADERSLQRDPSATSQEDRLALGPATVPSVYWEDRDFEKDRAAAFATKEGEAKLRADMAPQMFTLSGTATGIYASALNNMASALGAASMAAGYASTAIGHYSLAKDESSTAVGDSAEAQSLSSTAVGAYSLAKGEQASAFGILAKADGERATALGSEAVAVGLASTAVGDQAFANGEGTSAVGSQAIAEGVSAAAFGNFANAAGDNTVAVGREAAATQQNAVAVGSLAEAKGVRSVAIGDSSTADGERAVALGSAATATGLNATAIGHSSISNGSASLAAGYNSGANGEAAAAVGSNALAEGKAAAAFGSDSWAQGDNALALGQQSLAQGTGAVALGWDSWASTAGGVALGSGSLASRAGGVAGYVPEGATAAQRAAIAATTSTVDLDGNAVGAVSVGDEAAGLYRQITGVAAGSADTDAANIAQLKAAAENVKAGAVQYATNPDGSVNYNQVTLGNGQAPGGTRISNVAPGVVGTDAVNVNQLSAVSAASENRYRQLDNHVRDVAKKAYGGVAAAMAMESAPYVPGKVSYSAALGHYQGESAVGVSLRKTSDDGQWSITGGVSAASSGGAGVRVGVSGVF
jgi:autotransporter adhesin